MVSRKFYKIYETSFACGFRIVNFGMRDNNTLISRELWYWDCVLYCYFILYFVYFKNCEAFVKFSVSVPFLFFNEFVCVPFYQLFLRCKLFHWKSENHKKDFNAYFPVKLIWKEFLLILILSNQPIASQFKILVSIPQT